MRRKDLIKFCIRNLSRCFGYRPQSVRVWIHPLYGIGLVYEGETYFQYWRRLITPRYYAINRRIVLWLWESVQPKKRGLLGGV